MATRNIVPRANNEGSLGTSSKKWNDIQATKATIGTLSGTTSSATFTAATIGTATITTDNITTGNITTGNITTANITTLNPGTTVAAGTASAAPLRLTSGTNLTTASTGALEYDGTVFYTTPVASARGVSPSVMYSISPAGGFALSTASGVQSAFPTTGDVWTLAGSTTYLMEGVYNIQKATNSVTVAMAFALGGGASITSILYTVWGANAAQNTTTATTAFTVVDQVASTVVNATATANSTLVFRGLIRMNAGGTVTPQINFSGTAAGTPTMLAGSYIMFTPLGTNTNNIVGNVA